MLWALAISSAIQIVVASVAGGFLVLEVGTNGNGPSAYVIC
jgi:hypothetical protein